MRRVLHIKLFFSHHATCSGTTALLNMPRRLETLGTPPVRNRKHPLPRLPSVHGVSTPGSMDGRPSPFSMASRGLALAPAAGHGLVLSSAGAGRRVDGGLRSVAEVAATVFQSEKWEGEREDGCVASHRSRFLRAWWGLGGM